MLVERLLTGAIVLFGLVFLFFIIPTQVETVSFGRILPSTVPTVATIILIVVAATQFFTSKFTFVMDILVCIRAFMFVGLVVLAVWLMERFGFEFVAPLLAISIMLLVGERRWHWLILGGVLIPIGVWLSVERVLDRVLA